MKFINKEFFKSKSFKVSVISIVAVLVLLSAFMAGAKFGFDRALFLCNLNHNYERNFIGQRGGSWNEVSGRNAVGMHGIIGEVLTVGTTTLTVSDRDGFEKLILVSASTSIRSVNKNITISEIKSDSKIVVFGKPNDKGQIVASMIRVTPENLPNFDQNPDFLVPPVR